jgi:hypothetical protein
MGNPPGEPRFRNVELNAVESLATTRVDWHFPIRGQGPLQRAIDGRLTGDWRAIDGRLAGDWRAIGGRLTGD